jgi:hypothetical protein
LGLRGVVAVDAQQGPYELRSAELVFTGTFGPNSSPAAAPFDAVAFRLADLWT